MKLRQYISLRGGDEKLVQYIYEKFPMTKVKDMEDYPPQLKLLVDSTLEEVGTGRVGKILKYFLEHIDKAKIINKVTYPEHGYLNGLDYTLDIEMYRYHFILRIDGDVISGVAYPIKN